MKKLLTSFIFLLAVLSSFSQSSSLIINSNINLPKDSVFRKQLIESLNGFLSQKEKPNKENSFILKEDLLQTSVLVDELKAIEASDKRHDDNFYKGYLTNVSRVGDSTFVIQFSYIGIADSLPMLKASFTFLAKRKSNRIYFSAPLIQNTSAWQERKFNNTIVHYKKKLNVQKADSLFMLEEKYDKIMGAKEMPEEFYCCDNYSEVQKILGVDYKSNYNGQSYSSLIGTENGIHLEVNGTLTSDFTAFDPHDLWHARFHKVVSTQIINKPVDEGCAFLFGGSWGLTWEEIQKRFNLFFRDNPNSDWLKLYNEGTNFDPKAKYPLNVDYYLNALIVKRLMKEKDFSAVIELASCGKWKEGNENYFTALENITGITKATFNNEVGKMIKQN